MPTSISSPACLPVVVFLITGASKGLGRAIATVASRYYAQQQKQQPTLRHNTYINSSSSSSSSCLSSTKQARFVLVARSSKGLQETKNEILSTSTIAEAEEVEANKKVALSVDSNSTITFPIMNTLMSSTTTTITTTANEDDVICRTMDLSDLDRLDDNIDILVDDVDRLVYGCDNNGDDQNQRHDMDVDVVFVNNAGSLGHLGPTISSPSLMDMRQTIDLNITSSLWLSVRFAQYVKQQQQEQKQKRRPRKIINISNATIVNISSLLAISDDILSMGIYSTGKAARERYHTIIGKEEIKRIKKKDDESYSNNNIIIREEEEGQNNKNNSNTAAIKTLNYAPGPLETDMAKEIRKKADELDVDLKPHFQKKLLDSYDSAMKLIRVIDKNEFDTGSHIDYYDLH
mmetsp:Transcript_35279/g.38170  ORF Transcript_35279/g.38170 Transcript_35279/m.38170 type:complete len:403 (+) Transcript_35279:76-1284(+)